MDIQSYIATERSEGASIREAVGRPSIAKAGCLSKYRERQRAIMPTYRAEGIVIKRTNYSEADRIVTVFTKNRGKIAVIAKGARKPTSRKGGHLEILSHSIFSLAEGKNLDIITEAETVTPFQKLRDSLEKIGLGYYMAEFVNEFVPEGQAHYSLFRLFLMALSLLDDADTDHESLLVRSFELKALHQLGFAPEVRRCVICGRPLTWASENGFSPEDGGVTCRHCRRERGFLLRQSTLKLLRDLMVWPWSKVSRIDVGERPVGEIENLNRAYVEFILEKRLKSTNLLEKIRSNAFGVRG